MPRLSAKEWKRREAKKLAYIKDINKLIKTIGGKMELNNYELPEKYEVTCPECNHIMWLYHLEWFSIVCQSCCDDIEQTDCEIKEIY
jgi:hypothetical protein